MATLIKFELALLLTVLTAAFRQPNFTYVTGIWDIASKSAEYRQSVKYFLDTDENMIIFCDTESQEWIWGRRKSNNTNIAVRSASLLEEGWWASSLLAKHPPELVTLGHFNNDTLTFTKSQTLHESALDLGRMELLKDALSYDIFESEYLYWVDAGLMLYPIYNQQNNPWNKKTDQFTRKHNIYHKLAKDFQHPFNLRTFHN